MKNLEFVKGDTVYDECGGEYIYGCKVNFDNICGHVILPVEYPPYDDESTAIGPAQLFVENSGHRLYKETPTKKYDERIASLKKDIGILEEDRNNLREEITQLKRQADGLKPSEQKCTFMRFLAAVNPFLSPDARPQYLVLGPQDAYDFPGILDISNTETLKLFESLEITVAFDATAGEKTRVFGSIKNKKNSYFYGYGSGYIYQDAIDIAYSLPEAEEKLIKQSINAANKLVSEYHEEKNIYKMYACDKIIEFFKNLKKHNVNMSLPQFADFCDVVHEALENKIAIQKETDLEEDTKKGKEAQAIALERSKRGEQMLMLEKDIKDLLSLVQKRLPA